MPTIKEAFWSQVDKAGLPPSHRPELGNCWLWKGAAYGGYGYFTVNGKTVRAHRYAINAPIGLCACHHCDTPLCVRRSHLFIATQHDNVADRHAKGRDQHSFGESNHQAKLTAEQVADIRRAYADGIPQGVMARHYGVTRPCISHVITGHTWAGKRRKSA